MCVCVIFVQVQSCFLLILSRFFVVVAAFLYISNKMPVSELILPS